MKYIDIFIYSNRYHSTNQNCIQLISNTLKFNIIKSTQYLLSDLNK